MNKRTQICGVKVDVNNFWTDGKTDGLLKQNKRILFAKIDCLQSMLTIAKKDEDVIKAYCDMDYYFILIRLIDCFGEDNDLLFLSFLQTYTCLQDFWYDNKDLDERNEYYQHLLDTIISRTNRNDATVPASEEYAELFKLLIENNYYIDSLTNSFSKVPFSASALSGTEKDWCNELKKQGAYFNYSQASANKFLGKENKVAQVKRLNQINIKNRLISINPQFSGGVADSLINAGLIETFKGTADDTVDFLKSKSRESRVNGLILGMTVATFIGYCVTALTAIAVVWAGYLSLKKAEVERDTAQMLSKKNLENNVASPSDFTPDWIDTDGDGVVTAEERQSFFKKICVFGGIAVLLYNIL